ncbi:MAG: cobalt ECF transporter T component CbiQ [Lachnospiraceae bacterium]|nr:cobalt ECF transporter T component CbiQ [Lachnospiraceae bacterium]
MKIDYYAYRSGMRKWNAGFKVLLALGTLCLVIGFNRIGVSLFVAVVMGSLTLAVGKLPARVYLHYLTVPLVFMIVSVLMIIMEFSTGPIGEWNLSLGLFYVGVTRQGFLMGIRVFFRALAGVSALYMMAFSTPMNEFIFVLQKAHLPEILVELMHLIYRFIFILLSVAEEMQTAARARLGYRNLGQGFRTFAMVAGNLFLTALRRAGIYYDAMIARGYDGTLAFLTEERPIRLWQGIGATVYFALTVVIFLMS